MCVYWIFRLTLRPLFYGKSARETVEMNKLCVIDFGSKYMTSLDPKSKQEYDIIVELDKLKWIFRLFSWHN